MTDRLPSLKPKQVLRALQGAGFVVARTSGSHCRLVFPGDPSRKITLPLHGDDLKRGTLHSIIVQAGLTRDELLKLL